MDINDQAWHHFERTVPRSVSIKYGLRTTDHGLGYKTRTERYGIGLNTKKGSTLNKFSHERLHNKNRSYL